MKELKIDPELRDLLPPLTNEEYKQLEKNIVENGFDCNFPIMEWHGCIADGHNRYSICKKHNIEPVIGTLAYDTKDEVMEWMLDIQLGRRNLSPIQRIAVTEKYRPIYEKQAKENQGTRNDLKPNFTANLPQSSNKQERNPTTDKKLSDIAGVSEKTYRMGAKVLKYGNDVLKQRVLSGETSISAGYKELTQSKNEKKSNTNREINNTSTSTANKPTTHKTIVENGAILLPEDSEENKIMNNIARQMKSGSINENQIFNERELKTIATITNDAINSIFSYIFGNINFDNFSKSNFKQIENIMLDAKKTIDTNIKKMEEKVNE